MNPEAAVHCTDLTQLRAARAKRRLLEEELRLRSLEGLKRRVALRESAEAWEWLDPYSDILGRLGSADGWAEGYLISTAADRRYGAFWPFWRSWQEHARLRAAARVLYTMSPTVSGALDGICSYVVNTGHKPKAAEKPGRNAPASLVAACQEVIDEFEKHNEFGTKQQELFVKTQRDGDCFVRGFVQNDGMMVARVVGGEYVVEPVDLDLETQSYGIETDEEDTQTVEGYHVAYDGNNADAEYVPGDEMLMFKVNVDGDVKRGLTDLSFGTYDLFKSGTRLLENTSEGTAIQAAIAMVRQHTGSGANEVSEFVSGSADRQRRDAASGQMRSESRYTPGRIEDIPENVNYVAPPFMANAQAAVAVLQAVLRGAGRKWGTPEGFISGDDSNNNFASALVAEAPFSRRCSRSQQYYSPRFLAVYESALKAKCDRRKLRVNGRVWSWEEVKALITITVEPPSLQVRDSLKEAQEAQIHLGMGTTSRQKICQQAGNDWGEISRDNAEWQKLHPQPVQQQGQEGKPPPAGTKGGKEDGAAEPVQEGLETDGDGEEFDAQAVADLFYGLYGAKALGILKDLAGGLTEGWDEASHPRGKGGKFIAKGSSEAVGAAQKVVGDALAGKGSPKDLLDHLSILTVKQIRDLASKHGKTAPKLLRAELVSAVMQVVGGDGGKEQPKAAEQKPAPSPASAPAHAEKSIARALASGFPMTAGEMKAATGLEGEALSRTLAAMADAGQVTLHADHAQERPGQEYVRVGGRSFNAVSAGPNAGQESESPSAANPATAPAAPASPTGIASVDAAAGPAEKAVAARAAIGPLALLMSAGHHEAGEAAKHLASRLLDGSTPESRAAMMDAWGMKGFTPAKATAEAVRAVLADKFNVVLRSNMQRDAGTPEQKRAEAAAKGVTMDALHGSMKVPHEGPTAGGRGQQRLPSVAGPSAKKPAKPPAAKKAPWQPPEPSPSQQKVRDEFEQLYRGAANLSDAQIDAASQRLASMPVEDVRQAAHAAGLAFGRPPSKAKAAAELIARIKGRRGVAARTKLAGDKL